MLLLLASISWLVSLQSAVGEEQCQARSLLQRKARSLKQNVTLEPLKLIEVSNQYMGGGLRHFHDLKSCPLPCTQAHNQSEADVVFAFTAVQNPSRAFPSQVWVATFWESPEHYPAKSHDFDYSQSWRADATFPQYDMIPYQIVEMFDANLERFKADAPFPRRSSFAAQSGNDRKISIWISNCGLDKTARINNAERLHDAGVHFASYGRCLHNAESDAAHEGAHGSAGLAALQTTATRAEADRVMHFLRRTRAEQSPRDRDMYDTSSKQMFFYAAENSACAYYHTEKVYHGLLSGSIPVYNGNPQTIDKHVPKGSIIKTADFESTEDLAQYLLKVASNETLYNSYFDWWKQDLKTHSPDFRQKLLSRRHARTPEEEVEKRCAECAFFHSHGRNPKFDAKTVSCTP